RQVTTVGNRLNVATERRHHELGLVGPRYVCITRSPPITHASLRSIHNLGGSINVAAHAKPYLHALQIERSAVRGEQLSLKYRECVARFEVERHPSTTSTRVAPRFGETMRRR